MKTKMKAGIMAVITCTVLGSMISPVSAKEQPASAVEKPQVLLEGAAPRFMYSRTQTFKALDFDTIIGYYVVESTETSSGWRIAGVHSVDAVSKNLDVIGCSLYKYKYYDNYQGCEVTIRYEYIGIHEDNSGLRTVKIHV